MLLWDSEDGREAGLGKQKRDAQGEKGSLLTLIGFYPLASYEPLNNYLPSAYSNAIPSEIAQTCTVTSSYYVYSFLLGGFQGPSFLSNP